MFVAYGPARGHCGHLHRTRAGADECVRNDERTVRWKIALGRSSFDSPADRRVYAADAGTMTLAGWLPYDPTAVLE